MEKISVIVPIYNVEAYVKDCVESIINSTYSDLEIILVDDGSSDNSAEICDKYALTDSRICVIHKGNGGASSARNAGLEAASGEYIGFVDGDDVIVKNMYETLHNDIKKNNAQVAACGHKTVFENGAVLGSGTGRIYVWNNIDALKELLGEKRIASSVCNKLYDRKLFSGISFDVTVSSGEDRLMNYYLMKKADRVVFRSECLYVYRKRHGSATTRSFSGKQFSRIEAAKIIKADIEENLPQLRRYGVNCLVKAMLSSYSQSLSGAGFAPERRRIQKELNIIWKFGRKTINPALQAAIILLRLHPAVYAIGLRTYKFLRDGRAKLMNKWK